MKLSPLQEKIVNTSGNLIVRASAGTGKTHTMVNKIAKEINDNRTHKVVAAILLRFYNNNARIGASELTTNGLKYVYIPKTPIADITTDTAWLYTAIAKYLIIEKYSAYDVISEIPVEGNESRKTVSIIKELLKKIEKAKDDEKNFTANVIAIAEYLGYDTRSDHIKKLFKTISKASFHVAFEADKYKHIAITIHSSKGLEFEQIIVFAVENGWK